MTLKEFLRELTLLISQQGIIVGLFFHSEPEYWTVTYIKGDLCCGIPTKESQFTQERAEWLTKYAELAFQRGEINE